MKFMYLVCLAAALTLMGCNSANNEAQPSNKPISILSIDEGKYYITAIGMTNDQDFKFQQLFDQYIPIISGYYTNSSSNEEELQRLRIQDFPVYIVTDTVQEVFRTNEMVELDKYLNDKSLKRMQ